MNTFSNSIQDQPLTRLMFQSSSIAIAQFNSLFQIIRSSALFRTLLCIDENSEISSLSRWFDLKDLERLYLEDFTSELTIKKAIRIDSGETLFLKAKLIGYFHDDQFKGGLLFLENETDRMEAIVKTRSKVHELSEIIKTLYVKSPLGILKICPDTARILHANPRICKMLGYEKKEIQEKTFYEVTHREDWYLHKEKYNKSLLGDGEAFDFESRLVHKNGQIIWVHSAVAIGMDEEGNAIHDILSIVDVSEAHQAKMLIEEQVNTLNFKNQELEKYIDSNLQLENFAYIASHDLKTPLRTIGNFCQLLKRRLKSHFGEEEQEYMSYILNGVKDMSQLIEDLLNYSRIGASENLVTELRFPHIVDNVLRNLNAAIEERSALITTENIPEFITANKTKITQLFQNLIANGLKFQAPGVVPKIHIKGTEQLNHWGFEIIDNGIGIAKKNYDQVFNLFKRINGKTEYEGSGIGLAYCKRVVEKHGGEIWIESEEGKGASFCFTIARQN